MYIYVGKNKVKCLIDKEDLPLTKRKGYWLSVTNHGYVRIMKRVGKYDNGFYKYSNDYLHRLIMKAPSNLQVDHINGNRLDNRKTNLRLCVGGDNARNRKQFKGRYKGVYFNKLTKKWTAQITLNYKNMYLGSFENIKDAARCYNEKAKELHGEYAYLNKCK